MYRVVAGLYRAAIAIRLGFPCEAERSRMLTERLGRWDGVDTSDAGAVWVHAASLGEVLTVAPLLDCLKAAGIGRIVVTCHTATGRAAAERTVADHVHWFPVDTPAAVRNVLALVNPRAFIAVETEIWPSLLLLLADAGVASVMVNATVSERSLHRYLRVRSLVSTALGTLAGVGARDEAAKDRLLQLGAPVQHTIVTGDLKSDAFDEVSLARVPDLIAGMGVQVLVAASTHETEDEAVLSAFHAVRRRHPRARLVLAPRHPERARGVHEAARARGFMTKMRSLEGNARDWDVLVVDTTGELRGFMRSAAAVFVGGSFVDIGGHNLFEPAAFARCVVTGPSIHGVREQASVLSRRDALVIVDDATALAACWSRCLDDPLQATRVGQRAQAAVRESGGALARTMEMLTPLLGAARQPVSGCGS